MKPIYIFDLALRHNEWLANRQGVVSENIANASTTGFKARDLKPFAETLEETRLELIQTSANHLQISSVHESYIEAEDSSSVNATHSGNTVSLEREFAKTGDISRSFELNTGILKAFNRMLLMSAKG